MIQTTVTPAQVQAGLSLMIEAVKAIREAGSVPAGHLYAAMMNSVTLEGFESMVRQVVATGLVRRDGDLLVWSDDEAVAR